MSDQASQLRHLVLRAARQREAEALPPPQMVAVVGTRRGLGMTSVAAGLAQALVEQGARVVAIDADPASSELAARCGAEVPSNYDISAARQDIHETLVRAHGGLQIVPGVWDETASLPHEKFAQQLLRQFQQLGRHADWLVLDLGVAPADLISAWRDAIENFVVVTSTDTDVVMNTYKLIKQSLAGTAVAKRELFVNNSPDKSTAEEVVARVDRSCRRFLGFGLESAGYSLRGGDLSASLAEFAARLCEPPRENRPIRKAA